MRGAIMAVAALAVAGCVEADVVPGPGGQPAVLIDCSNAWSDGDCYREAAKQCPAGYELLPSPAKSSQSSQTTIFVRCTPGAKAN